MAPPLTNEPPLPLPQVSRSNCHLSEVPSLGQGDPRYDQREMVEMLSDFLLNRVPQSGDLSRAIVVRFAKQAVANCVVFAEKQSDYGPENIARRGESGVLTRVCDKVARLEHLEGQSKAPRNEAVRDSWGDLANYGTIGQMVNNGEWPGCLEKHLLCPPQAEGDVEDRPE